MGPEIIINLPVLGRIDNVQPTAQHTDDHAPRGNGAGHSHGIRAVGHAGDDDTAAHGNLIAQPFGAGHGIGGTVAGTDNGNDRFIVQSR